MNFTVKFLPQTKMNFTRAELNFNPEQKEFYPVSKPIQVKSFNPPFRISFYPTKKLIKTD